MEREQAVSIAKLVSYLLIIVGIIILSATIIYFSTVPIDWLSYVGIIVGGLMLGIGTAIINLIKKLKLDIKYEN
jgi:small-conductance mechanosensitive channel